MSQESLSKALSTILYENGRTHGLAAQCIQKGSIERAVLLGLEGVDIDHFVHNGPYSLALFQSIGLGLELFLKSILVDLCGTPESDLKRAPYGHNIVKIFADCTASGFVTSAVSLSDLVAQMGPPYQAQTFRYGRPDQLYLPANFDEVFAVLDVVDLEIAERLGITLGD